MRDTSIPAQTIDRAAEWLVAMRESSISSAEREAFADWLRASPEHVRAYLDAAGLWDDASRLDPALPAEVSDLLSAANTARVVPLPTAAAFTQEPRPAVSARVVRSPHRWRVAAALLVSLVAGLATWWYLARPPSYVAGVGELRVLTLEDGSVVRLNSRSEVRVRFTEEIRDVDLVSGQALFEVAKNLARPFVVHSGDISVRAVGTAFDVYRKDKGTVVTVVEGRVVVAGSDSLGDSVSAPPPAARLGSLTVSAGEQVLVTLAGAIERTPAPNVAAATSWLEQELIFTGEPLSTVVEEFNRYSRRAIVISDPALGDLRINAVFHSTNPQSLLQFLTRLDGVAVEETEREIRIVPRQLSSTSP